MGSPGEVARTKRRASWAAVALVTALALVVNAPGAEGSPRGKPRLPNLVPLAPHTFFGPTTETDPNYLFGGGAVVEGCTPDEIARKLARRCLRFDTILANIGRGPFEIAYVVDPLRGVLAAHQRIYTTTGNRRSRFATETEFHPTHAHFHIKDIYLAKLWRVNRRRQAVGRRPVASSDKNGFCPMDSTPVEPDAQGPRYFCGIQSIGSEGALQVVGISPGWADIYSAYLPDQYIEISDVRRGFYVFELEIDPHNFFLESSESDNRVCLLLALERTSASALGPRRCPGKS